MDEERSKSERMEEERAVAQAVCEVGVAAPTGGISDCYFASCYQDSSRND